MTPKREFDHDVKLDVEARVRQGVKAVLEEVLEEEVTQHLEAGYRELTPTRRGERNGHYTRNLLTPAGKIERLEVPRDREGEFVPEVLERYKRMTGDVEEAILEMYLSGISVRRIAGVTDALSGVKVDKDAVSRIARRLEEHGQRRVRSILRRGDTLIPIKHAPSSRRCAEPSVLRQYSGRAPPRQVFSGHRASRSNEFRSSAAHRDNRFTSQMFDQIDEDLSGERAAAFAGELGPPRSPARRFLTVERSRRERRNATSGSCCSRRIWHQANRSATECIPVRRSERADPGRSGHPEWQHTRGFRKR